MDRAPVDGSIEIYGATGPRSHFVNGIYELTEEICNSQPVYRKKIDKNIWLECVSSYGNLAWHVKPTGNRGAYNRTSYGFCQKISGNTELPLGCIVGGWEIGTGQGFVVQTEVAVIQL